MLGSIVCLRRNINPEHGKVWRRNRVSTNVRRHLVRLDHLQFPGWGTDLDLISNRCGYGMPNGQGQ